MYEGDIVRNIPYTLYIYCVTVDINCARLYHVDVNLVKET